MITYQLILSFDIFIIALTQKRTTLNENMSFFGNAPPTIFVYICQLPLAKLRASVGLNFGKEKFQYACGRCYFVISVGITIRLPLLHSSLNKNQSQKFDNEDLHLLNQKLAASFTSHIRE